MEDELMDLSGLLDSFLNTPTESIRDSNQLNIPVEEQQVSYQVIGDTAKKLHASHVKGIQKYTCRNTKCGSQPSKRSKTTLSERKRREKINMNMTRLRELVPTIKKDDKITILLDKAIDHIKGLQSTKEYMLNHLRIMHQQQNMFMQALMFYPFVCSQSAGKGLP